MFPTVVFRQAYDAFGAMRGERADVEYVRVLNMTATHGEARVASTLTAVCSPSGNRLTMPPCRPHLSTATPMTLPVPDLAVYDALLRGGTR